MTNSSNVIVRPPVNGISRIKLNEPSSYNALSSKTLNSLINTFKNLNGDDKTKVRFIYLQTRVEVDLFVPLVVLLFDSILCNMCS